MEDDTQELGLNFSDYVDQSLIKPVVVETAVASEPDSQPVATEGTAAPVVTETPQAAPIENQPERATPSDTGAGFNPFDIFRKKGLNVADGVDPTEFYNQAADQLLASATAQRERDRLLREIEQLKASQLAPQGAPAQSPEPVTPVTPAAQAVARLLRVAEDPPADAWTAVDEVDGRFVPKPEYGQAGIDAARSINNFLSAKEHNAELILKNPGIFLQDYQSEIQAMMKETAKKEAEQLFNSWQDSRAKQEQEARAAQQQAEADRAHEAFHTNNKSKIFKLDMYGNPVQLFENGPMSTTPFGTVFFESLNNLSAEFPNADQLKLMNRALAEADLKQQIQAISQQAPAPVAPVVPATPVTPTPDQLKEQFLRQRQSVAVQPDSSVAVAQPEDFDNFANMSFAAAMRRDPDNKDNPIFRTV